MRLKRWVRVLITLLVIHISFFIWKETGSLGSLAQTNNIYLILCILSWCYLLIGQVFIYEQIWK